MNWCCGIHRKMHRNNKKDLSWKRIADSLDIQEIATSAPKPAVISAVQAATTTTSSVIFIKIRSRKLFNGLWLAFS